MCRVLLYLGKTVSINELLFNTDNSLVKQTYHPHFINLLNLAGFGMLSTHTNGHTSNPLIYKSTNLPFYDRNLRNLALDTTSNCFLAHVRGVDYDSKQVISTQNVHPFNFSNTSIALAHNGNLEEFEKIKYDLVKYIKKPFLNCIKGTTDTEWIYALLLSQLDNPEQLSDINNILAGLIKAFAILKKLRSKYNIIYNSPINLFITDGHCIAATRYTFDYGWPDKREHTYAHANYHSLWYTYGEEYGLFSGKYQMKESKETQSLIIASEPLTEDCINWIEIPEYTFVYANLMDGKVQFKFEDISFYL